MTKPSHTPGPRKYVKVDIKRSLYAHVVSDSRFFVAACPDTIQQTSVSHPVTDKEAEANARLISTAPDGLALAEMVIESNRSGYAFLCEKDWQSIIAAARALKAKAEGNR